MHEYGWLGFARDDWGAEGIDADVLDEVARRTGCRFEKFFDSRVRIWNSMVNGSLDMTVSAIRTEDRKQFASFVVYFRGHNRLLLRSDLANSVHALKDFTEQSQLRLAVVKGFKHGPQWDDWIDALRQRGRVDEYADANVAARLVARGRADAFISDPMVWGRILAGSQLEGKVSVLNAFPDEDYIAGFALSRKRVGKDDVQKIQNAVDAMRADGTLLKIFKAYAPEADALNAMP